MTAKPSCWPPQLGEVWVGRTIAWLAGGSGTLAPLGDDAPWQAAKPADEVWDADGPLIAPTAARHRAGLVAHLRREAEDVEWRAALGTGMTSVPVAAANRLRERADVLESAPQAVALSADGLVA